MSNALAIATVMGALNTRVQTLLNDAGLTGFEIEAPFVKLVHSAALRQLRCERCFRLVSPAAGVRRGASLAYAAGLTGRRASAHEWDGDVHAKAPTTRPPVA